MCVDASIDDVYIYIYIYVRTIDRSIAAIAPYGHRTIAYMINRLSAEYSSGRS